MTRMTKIVCSLFVSILLGVINYAGVGSGNPERIGE